MSTVTYKGRLFIPIWLLFFIAFFPGIAKTAEWFVRPYGSGIKVKDGKSYETAWEGLDKVVWGPGGVQAGDTLWICDTHGYHPSLSHYALLYYATKLTVGASGTPEAKITIRGDYPGHPGIIYGINRLFRSGWVNSGVNGVYIHGLRPSVVWLYEVNSNGEIIPYNFQVHESNNYGDFKYTDVDIINDTITVSIGTWSENQRVIFFQDSNNLPSPLNLTENRFKFYYLKNVSGRTFQLSETPGGPAIDLTTTGSATTCVMYQAPSDSDLALYEDGTFTIQSGSGNGKIIYVKPPTGISPNNNATLFAFNDDVIKITDQSHISIINLSVYGRIPLTRVNYILIDNVSVRDVYGKAIPIWGNSNYITITNCHIDRAGDGIYTISQGGYTPNYVTVKNTTVKNIIPYWFDGGSTDQHAIAFQAGIGNVAENNYCEYAQRSICHYVGSDYALGSTVKINANLVVDSYRSHIGLADARSVNAPIQKLVDPSRNFSSLGIVPGNKLRNRTTGAVGTITAIETTVRNNDTLVATLAGGSRQTWQRGDTYQVYHDPNIKYNGDAINSHGLSAASKSTVVITNNIVIHSDGVGIRVEIANNRNTTIYNNTIYDASVGIYLTTYLSKLKDMVVKNNIIYKLFQSNAYLNNPYFVYITSSSGFESDIYFNNNLYYDPSDPLATNTSFYLNGNKTFMGWKAAIQSINPLCETSSVYNDPKFKNDSGGFLEAEDFKLADNSPARAAGQPWSGMDRDFGGFPFNKTKPSIGAWSWRGKWGNISQPSKIGGLENIRPTH